MAKDKSIPSNIILAKEKFKYDTIQDMVNDITLKVGMVVDINGYYSADDGATHKRVIADTDDGSGVQLSNNLWANLIKPVTFYYSNFEELKQSSIFVGAKAVVYGLVFDIKKTSNVGFEDELHIKTVRNVYANFSLDESKFDYIVRKQNEYIAKYLDLNARNKEVNIVLQGDSITYGHDTQSSDKIDPPTTVLPDGSKHTVTRSPNTIDKKLQEYLREVTRRGNINVINRGYSGDWAEKSYTRWRTTANSNLTLFLLGQNDQGGNWVPEKSRTIEEFFKWNLMLGIREILRGGAVVFTNGYRAKSLESGKVRQTFLEMTKSVSETIGAVFFDTTDFLLGADDTYYSDGVHLNSKGNARVAARMTAFFLGENIIKPVSVKIGDYLGVNYDYFNVYGATYGDSAGSSNGLEVHNKTAELRGITRSEANKTAYFPFYLDSPECEVQLLCGNSYGWIDISCDFETNQHIQKSDYIQVQYREKPKDKISKLTIPSVTNFRIYGKGFHVLKIQNNQENLDFYLNQILIKEVKKNRYDIDLGKKDVTLENLAEFFNTNNNVLYDLLSYNNNKIQGYLRAEDTHGTVFAYYETYAWGSTKLVGTTTNPIAFFIKIYAQSFNFLEKVFAFKQQGNGYLDLIPYYEATAFDKPNAIIQQLNTPYMATKMKQENVYDDYITYMDEKTIYDKQQRKFEQNKQLAYEEALKENPELTFEEFMSVQPMTLNLLSEPEPSEKLKRFMEKYL